MKHYSLLMAFLTLALSQSSFANSHIKDCPPVNDIAALKITNAVLNSQDPRYWLAGIVNNNPQADQNWTFFISIEAKNPDEAIRKANTELSSLVLVDACKHHGVTTCMYQNEHTNALAITPAIALEDLDSLDD